MTQKMEQNSKPPRFQGITFNDAIWVNSGISRNYFESKLLNATVLSLSNDNYTISFLIVSKKNRIFCVLEQLVDSGKPCTVSHIDCIKLSVNLL